MQLMMYRRLNDEECSCCPMLDEYGNPVIENELKKRIENIALNIKKCGSAKMLLNVGGEKTRTYLKHTHEMLIDYLILSQVGSWTFRADEVQFLFDNISKTCNTKVLVVNGSWGEVEEIASDLRHSFLEYHYLERVS